jgi:urease accessory protein
VRTGEGGLAFLLDLPEVPSVAEGDAPELDDGRLVRVPCADEALLEVDAEDARTLARLAWYLGNRHLPTEIGPGRLRIRADHVIEDMLRRLGATVRPLQAPFHPEGGACGHGRTHGQAHAHEHGHDHDPGS